jgi:(p)ppGpp synthase/HD superfamily hydrolase
MSNKKKLTAREFATLAHQQPSAEQRYGNEPYSKHLEDVVKNAERYIYCIKTEDKINVLNAAWMHDLIEDTEHNARSIKHYFNEMTAKIVLSVSNVREIDKIEEIMLTLVQIRKAGHLSRFVKLCDRMANGRNSKNGFDEKSERLFKRYKNEYPIFRYALKIKNEYTDMWVELDKIFNYE